MTNEEILQIFDEEKTPYWCLLHKKSKGTLGECGKQGGKEDRTLERADPNLLINFLNTNLTLVSSISSTLKRNFWTG